MNEELLDKAQEYVRTAPLKHVSDFIWWAKGVLEVREEYQGGRKKRSDAGKPRAAELQNSSNCSSKQGLLCDCEER